MTNEIEDGMGCAGLVPTKAEESAEDAFRREREACERLEAENIRLRNTIAGIRAALIPLAEIELRLTQARLACGIGRKKDRTAFLLGEMERIETALRNARAEG